MACPPYLETNLNKNHVLQEPAEGSLVQAGPQKIQILEEKETAPTARATHRSEAELLDAIIQYISITYVRKDNRYYLVSDPSEKYSSEDIVRSLVVSLPDIFATETLTQELIKRAMKRAFVEKHSDPSRTIPIWNGRSECRPGNHLGCIPNGGFVSINTWVCPDYRFEAMQNGSTRMLDVFLQRTVPHEVDQRFIKDWFAWVLQNEAEKPGWAPILYSRNKGTGKSTLVELLSELIGTCNTANCTSVDGVIGRFSGPIFEKKLISIEEVKLQQGSRAANAMKTFITEKALTVEKKGVDARQIQQCAAFIMTTNHLPTWIEEGERRYLVVEMDHDGHAHGTQRESFVKFIKLFKAKVLKDPKSLQRIYLGLLTHEVSPAFDPHSIPFELVDTPVMRKLQGAGSEVMQDRLAEMLTREDIKAIPEEDLCRKVGEDFQIAPNRLKHLMLELSWTREDKKWGGKDYTRKIWLAPEHTMHRGKVKDRTGQVAVISCLGYVGRDEIEIIENQEPTPVGPEELSEDY